MAYYIFGNGLISSLVGGVIWLVALKVFYNLEWFKAFMITVVVWISATVRVLVANSSRVCVVLS